MTKTNKQPRIRFEGYQDDWEQRKLGEYSRILAGGTPKTQIKEYWNPKEIPWMSSGEINKKRLYDTDNKISKLGLDNSSARWVKEKSVLIALAGQGKTRGTVAINELKLTTNQSIVAIEPNNELNYEFLFQHLERRYDELRLLSSGDGSRGGLNKRIISDLMILSPKIKEQQKIGTFFKELDDTITLHQEKLELLKKMKKSYLQKMFPKKDETVPEIRFAGFTDDWEQRKLGETVDYIKGFAFKSNLYKNEGVRIIRVSDLSTHSIKEYGDKIFIHTEVSKIYNNYVINKNEIIITTVGSKSEMIDSAVGRPIIVRSDNEGLLNQNLVKLSAKDSYDSNFIYNSLLDKKYSNYIATIERGNANQANITITDLWEYSVKVPRLNEQQKIGTFFQQFDDTIALHQEKLELLKETKKSFLQKMFV